MKYFYEVELESETLTGMVTTDHIDCARDRVQDEYGSAVHIISLCLIENTLEMDTETGYVEYHHNNSGGQRWVSAEGWIKLQTAGWELGDVMSGPPGQYMGAVRRGLTLQEAVAEWETLTGSCATDIGCPCCGQPHHFEEYDSDDEMVDSGPTIQSNCSF